jgi:hypothetical protein
LHLNRSLSKLAKRVSRTDGFTYRGKGERGKGKGEREEIIGRGLRGIPIIDTPLREGLQTRIGGKKRKKLLACCE